MKQPIAIEGLWAIAFGSGRGDFETDDLYFTAGPGNGDEIETHGLFGELDFGRRRCNGRPSTASRRSD